MVFVDDMAAGCRHMPFLVWPTVLACALVGLLAPAAASAETYVVNDTGDVADAAVGSEGCDSVAGGTKQCTLRAAIQESNDSTAVDDTIGFEGSLFNGEAADKIPLGSGFPAITDKVHIDGDSGGQCTTAAGGVKGPCAWVEKTVAGAALVVENADGVTIDGLAITGGLTGIAVFSSSEGFSARNNWLGVKLDGTAGANNTGIFLDPGSNGATIGGTAATDRNVFANNGFEGLDIQGASLTQVSGNYFGVAPDGQTQAANGKNVEVTSSFTVEAIDNEIGAQLSAEALATPACDGACNVISGALSMGVDLLGEGGGEEPPAKATTVAGNFIGLTATGSALGNATIGVQVGKSHETTIGGGESGANHLNGGSVGVSASSLGVPADELIVDENLIGVNPAGTETLAAPSSTGIFVSSAGIASEEDAAAITDNTISMPGGVGIEQHGVGALISGNSIGRGTGGEPLSGASTGIRLYGDDSLLGNAIESNTIENSGENGIQIENDDNLVIGNVVEGADGVGIRIQPFGGVLPATGNAIGGDTAQEENAISESGLDAIEVAGAEDDDTQIARNFGDSNKGLFIDLGADGSGNKLTGPNDGIQVPTISTATVSGASGAGARPGATVRVFRKATASPGEVASFLGKATADGSGQWTLSYGSAIPGGTPIAATQSDTEGTSELVLATTATPPADGGGGGTGGGADDGKDKSKDKGKDKGKGKAGKDKTAPQTTIVKGPKASSRKRTAKFKFVSSEPNSTFQCKLDKKPFKPCRSPRKYKRLKPGKHVFQVRAIDAAGNKDKTPAKRRFRVLR